MRWDLFLPLQRYLFRVEFENKTKICAANGVLYLERVTESNQFQKTEVGSVQGFFFSSNE